MIKPRMKYHTGRQTELGKYEAKRSETAQYECQKSNTWGGWRKEDWVISVQYKNETQKEM